jgi:hypothetical protein
MNDDDTGYLDYALDRAYPPLRIDITGVAPQATAPEEVSPATGAAEEFIAQGGMTLPADAQSMTPAQMGQVVLDGLAGMSRGGVKAVAGFGGDVEQLGTFIKNFITDNQGGGFVERVKRSAGAFESPTLLQTSKDVEREGIGLLPGAPLGSVKLPPVIPPGVTTDRAMREKAAAGGELAGEVLADPFLAARAVKAGVGAVKSMAQEVMTTPPVGAINTWISRNEFTAYQNQPKQLQGFKTDGPNKGFDEQKYKHAEFLEVKLDDGTTFYDAIRGLNKPHALSRAFGNWPAASEIRTLTRLEAEKVDPSLVKEVDAAMKQVAEMEVKIGKRKIKVPADQAAILSKAIKNLTPAEQLKFKSDTAKTFVERLTALPSKQEFGAAAIGGRAKKGWYEGSTQAIVNVFGPDANRFAALLSATSPQTSVESNLYNALQIWKNWIAAGRPTERDAIIKVMGESVQGGKGEESVLDAWKNNSVAALTAEDPSKLILSGPKVNSFMLNLQGNVEEVTNDAWMASFSLVDQKIFGGSLTKTDPGKGPGYLAMNARVRETATYLTKLTGETWTPAEVQETIWSWAKTLYETAGAAGETRSAVQLVRDNAITDELISSTPDFRTLFYDERFAPILEQSGYGEQLARLRAASSASDVATGSQKPGTSGQAAAIDPEAQRKLLERNAKRLDTLRKQRELAAAEKAALEKGAK